ncbi:hypothetical protein FB45DRAFT_890670 [Roridomyces roridus]|uniref:MYND-type domain-containing protein n=1 Tax=Roridomyces roridus TaxID=1738132 RepID=A0AAD7FW22_9AGAR|nr:hypothetical protein FB45DRAFT_890670 [Roridomyces roridus]
MLRQDWLGSDASFSLPPPHLSLRPLAKIMVKGVICCYEPSCDNVSSEGYTMKRCKQCKSLWYCSVACQRKHWPFHKAECQSRVVSRATVARLADSDVPEKALDKWMSRTCMKWIDKISRQAMGAMPNRSLETVDQHFVLFKLLWTRGTFEIQRIEVYKRVDLSIVTGMPEEQARAMCELVRQSDEKAKRLGLDGPLGGTAMAVVLGRVEECEGGPVDLVRFKEVSLRFA